MTRQQKEWLDNNKRFQTVGSRLAPGDKIIESGMLHADGTFEAKKPGTRTAVRQGSFEVIAVQRAQGGGVPNMTVRP